MFEELSKEEEIENIKIIRANYESKTGNKISVERAQDILGLVKALLEMARNGLICSRCGELQHFYEIRK